MGGKALGPAEETSYLRIEPSRGWVPLRLKELWVYRELLYFLVWRDVKVRYKQTAMGATWAIIQPFMTMAAFTLFFGRVAKLSSDGVPYPIFSYAALVPWTFFASAMGRATYGLVGNGNLLKKVYFPRLALPIAAVLSGAVDFSLAFLVLLGMMLYYGIVPTINTLWVPLFVLLAHVAALGMGLWLSATNLHYRDVGQMMPFVTQLWMLATPIAYSSSLLREKWGLVYALNPMASVVDGFRWALLGTPAAPTLMLLSSSLMALAILVSGAFYFRHMEKSFADRV